MMTRRNLRAYSARSESTTVSAPRWCESRKLSGVLIVFALLGDVTQTVSSALATTLSQATPRRRGVPSWSLPIVRPAAQLLASSRAL